MWLCWSWEPQNTLSWVFFCLVFAGSVFATILTSDGQRWSHWARSQWWHPHLNIYLSVSQKLYHQENSPYVSINLCTRVHQNSKKFSKSHGILIYFVPTCILGCTKIPKSFQNLMVSWYILYWYVWKPFLQKKWFFLHFPSLAAILKKMARAQGKMR